jgi:hypothetical protein
MNIDQRLGPARLLIILAKALFIAWALVFLAEHFGWHLLREAGGQVVRAAF